MKYFRLGDIAPIEQGYVEKAESYWLLNLDKIESNTGKITEYNYVTQNQLKGAIISFDTSNVLYSKLRPYLNKVVVPKMPGYATSELLPLRPNKEIIDKTFLAYFLRSPHFVRHINEKSSGAKMPRAKTKDLLMTKVPCPEIDAQKKIVKKFSRLEKVINCKKEEIQLFDELIKARFVEMFGDPGTPGQRYPTDKLGNVAFVKSSHRVFTTEFVEKGIPFFRGTEIGILAEGGIPKDPFYITEKKYKELASDESKPLVGDLLMPSICNKGQVWMVDTEKPFYYKDGRVLCISPNRNIFDSKYLQFYLKLRTEIEYPKLGSGSTFAEFKIFQLKELEVDLPPKYMQERFKNFIMQVDKSKAVIQKSIDQTQMLFDSLMQEYFS